MVTKVGLFLFVKYQIFVTVLNYHWIHRTFQIRFKMVPKNFHKMLQRKYNDKSIGSINVNIEYTYILMSINQVSEPMMLF